MNIICKFFNWIQKLKLFNIILNKKKSYIKKVLLAKYYIIINSKTKGKELKTGGDAILSLLKKLKLKKTCEFLSRG